MKIRLSSLLCAALACASMCLAADDEVVVLLGSEHALLPTHVASIEAASTDLSADYLSKLQSILIFDLNYNGMTRVVTGKEKDSVVPVQHAVHTRQLSFIICTSFNLSTSNFGP